MRVPSPLLNQPKVGAPHTVRFHRMLKWAPCRALSGDASGAPPPAPRASRSRPSCSPPATAPRLIRSKIRCQLPRSPAHVRLAQTKHGLFNRNRRLVGMPDSIPVQFNQTRKAMLPVTAQPAIATLARDPKSSQSSVIVRSSRSYSKTKRARSSIALLVFQGIASLQNIPTMPQCVNNAPGLFCQQSPRFIPFSGTPPPLYPMGV